MDIDVETEEDVSLIAYRENIRSHYAPPNERR